MKHIVLSKIISMALIPVMLLSTASCGKKTHGKTARKISSEEPSSIAFQGIFFFAGILPEVSG